MKKYVAQLAVCLVVLPLRVFAQAGGSVVATQLPIPGTTSSITTLNPAVIVQGSFNGSASSTDTVPFSGRLTFADALARGLSANLGLIDAGVVARAADAGARIARSALLPQIDVDYTQARRDTNLAASGIRLAAQPGFVFPTLVGPYNIVDVRGYVSQPILDVANWQAFRATRETVRESNLLAQDARDQVMLAVGAAYLQVAASQARLISARAQLDTADALYSQTAAEQHVGVAAQIDVNRAQVEVLTQRQRLVSLQTDLTRQKINLARLTGLPPTDQYEIAGDVPYAPPPTMAMETAIAEALGARADVKAADAAVRAAERGRAAASAERLPTVFVNADYGAIGNSFSDARGTFFVAGSVRIPLWEGGRVEGRVQLADAALRQRRAERENVRAQVVADVRNAWLEVQAATSQVELARTNASTLRETLSLTRQRFSTGITDSLDVVRAQEAVATADLDIINAIFAHNVAKLALARALGVSSDGLQRFLVVR